RKTVTSSPSAGYDDVARTSHDSIDHYLEIYKNGLEIESFQYS
ncbi:481_t:CDS:2, partial [Funneliformis geosporum]